MASAIQIVPMGQHPHVETFIYDNTEIYDTPATAVDDSIKTIHVFRSDKGIDNKIIKKVDQQGFTNTFGKTNYAKYGQALMMPYASLGSELTSVYCMRLMPDDATYAHSAVYAYYRTADVTLTETVYDELGNPVYGDDGITPTTKEVNKKVFQVMFRNKHFAPEVDNVTNRLTGQGVESAATTKAKLTTLINASVEDIDGTDIDGSTWTCVPLVSFCSTGRGIYGNNYKWRITKNKEYEKDYSRKIYTFEVMSAESGVEKVATYVGSLATCVVNNQSLLINDVITDYDAGEYPVDINVFEDSIDIIYDEYAKFLTELAGSTGIELTIPGRDEFDILFGKELNSTVPYEYYMTVSPDSEYYPVVDDVDGITMGDALGVYFNGGYDGAFSTFIDPTTKKSINGALELVDADRYNSAVKVGIQHLKFGESTMEDVYYAKAFSGLLDKSILASRRIPADYLLDANYSYTTKVSLVQFAIARNDALVYIDTGCEYNTFSDAALKRLENLYGGIFANRIVSVNSHCWNTRDPFTQRKVEVTPTHYIARYLPVHWKEHGIQTPFAKAFARIKDHTKNTLVPAIDLHESDLMEALTNMRINYIEAIGENEFQRGIQNTAQDINSDLTEESNMHVLLYIKRNIEKDIFDSLYNFANASERATFRQVEMAKYESIIGTLVQSFDIRFDMTEWESDRQIIHCYVDVTFRTLMKRGIIEIDVNRRDYTV